MFGWAFLMLLLSATFFVLFRGDREQKQILGILFCAYFGTYALYRWGGQTWLHFQTPTIILDGTAFVLLSIIAFRSKRFWPLWIASFQLMPLLTYAATPLGTNLVSHALGVVQGLWGFFQLAILLMATLTMQMRSMKAEKPKTGQ